jgi:hypothetical protein
MEHRSLLLGEASGVPEAGVARLDGRDDGRGDSSKCFEDRRAPLGADRRICFFRLRFLLGGHEIRAAICRPHHVAAVA